MGIQFFETQSQPTMKVLLFVALAIAAVVAEPEAEADADAAYYYGNYFGNYNRGFYGYGRRTWNNYGYGLGGAYRYGGYNYPSAYGYTTHHFGKRSADAEPEAEADAAVLYSNHYGNQGVYGQRFYGMGNYYGAQWNNGYRYGAYPYASTYGAYPYTQTYGYPASTVGYTTRHFGKRSADAEPEADADAAYYYGNYYNHHQRYYGQRYNGFRTYSAGYPYTYGRNFYGYGNRFGWW